ncbi:uncharacterized protein LOC114527393 [Dendronephthya gigantea]|uniref:uncharacterized protein LOC114527393 n=1 Tax=Dendronephthya gigantea TaxID=151771 RepID=UPI00106C752C|nr:uncharacterized protein LOC114527393 [Dendronephthya gigantea]
MATTEFVNSVQGDATGTQISPDSPPGDEGTPPGKPQLTESTMLQQMHEFLGKIVEHLPIGKAASKKRAKRSKRKRSSERSASPVDSDSDGEFSSSEPPAKRTKEVDARDSISITASDEDIRQLLGDPPDNSGNKNADDKVTGHDKDGADQLLKELEAALQDKDELGGPVNEQLANIAIKRWGVKLTQDKLTSTLAKHVQPQNCSATNVARVNPEIWSSLNSLQRKDDLRVANVQQVLQKVTFATLANANELLSLKTDTTTATKQNLNDMLANCIDILALLGHGVSELSQLRRERLKPALKTEYHSLCSATVEPASKLLFGDDLAKQIRDKKETNRIGHTVTSKYRNDTKAKEWRPASSWRNKQYNFKNNSSASGYAQPPFRRGYRSTSRKKHTNQTPNDRGKK